LRNGQGIGKTKGRLQKRKAKLAKERKEGRLGGIKEERRIETGLTPDWNRGGKKSERDSHRGIKEVALDIGDTGPEWGEPRC